MDEPVRVVLRPEIPEDPSDLPEGMIGRVVTDDNEFVGYLPRDILIEDEEEE